MVKQCAMIRRPLEGRILFLRGRKVLLDSDLAELYRVTVKRLNQQVKRNAERFPEDFMFRLTPEESRLLRSQIATSNGGRGGRRYLPFVFTEHGAIMAASVLNSQRAVEMSIFVVRAFVRLNEILASNRQLAAKVMELDRRLSTQDVAIHNIVAAIKRLMRPPSRRIPQIGFRSATSQR
jgi:ORF6N domain